MIRIRVDPYSAIGFLVACGLLACSPAGDTPGVDTGLTETPQPVPPTAVVTPTPIPTPAEPTQPPTATVPPDFGPFRLAATFEGEGLFVDFYDQLDSTGDGQVYATLDGWATYRLEGDRMALVVDEAPAEILGVDDTGGVWAASESLVFNWDGEKWTEYGPDAGWISDPMQWYGSPYGLFSASDGTVWTATSQDVRSFDGERWRIYTYADMNMEPVAVDDVTWSGFSLAEADGVIWVGECTFCPLGPIGGVGARWFDGDTWHGVDSPAATGCVTEVAVAPDGAVWLDIGPSLYRHNPATGAWDGFRLPVPPDEHITRFGVVTELNFDANGDPWLGLTTCGGAHCYMDLVRYHFERASGTYHLVGSQWPIESVMHFDGSGQGWLFGLGEVSRLEGDDFETVNYLMVPLPYGTTQTPDGTIWAIGEMEETFGVWQIAAE